MTHFVYNAVGNYFKHIIGYARPVGRHCVHRRYGTYCNYVFISSEVTLNAHRLAVGYYGEVLPDFIVKTRLGYLLAEDIV